MSKLFVIVGPSGAGKDSLLQAAVATFPEIHVVRRVITRPAKAGGEDHEEADNEAFAERDKRGEFAVAWAAHGLHYGIPKREIASGAAITIFNGSRAALPEIMLALPEARVIEITASAEVLAERLARRGRESADDILARLARAASAAQITCGGCITIQNDGNFSTAAAELFEVLRS